MFESLEGGRAISITKLIVDYLHAITIAIDMIYFTVLFL